MTVFRALVAVLSVTLLASVAACSSGSPTTDSDERVAARANLHETTWPVPTADSWRTSSVASGGLPDGVRSSDLQAQDVELGPAPIFGVTYDKDSVFVLGGAPHLLDLFTEAQGNDLPGGSPVALARAYANYKDTTSATPYVARIDPATMKKELLELPRGSTPNYPGSIVAHENGMLYVVATATLFEVDPANFEITRTLDLPLSSVKSGSTIYNTLQVSARDGDLLLKTSTQRGKGLLVAVDVDGFQVRSRLETALSNARMTAVLQDGTEYLYLPGETDTLRFVMTDDAFTLDESWSKAYRTKGDGTTPGVAMTPTGDHDTVVFPNNNTVSVRVSAPLAMFWQSTTDSSSGVSSVNATSTESAGGSFPPPPADPFDTSIVVAADAVNGRLAAWQIADDGSLRQMWVTDRYALSAGAAIVSDQKRLYTDDRECDADGSECTLYLVVADLMTGREIARVQVAGSQPTIGRIFIDSDAVYYIATQGEGGNGYVTKVTADR